MSDVLHPTHDQCGLCAAPAHAFSIDVMTWLCVDHLAAFEDWCDEHRDTPSAAFMVMAEVTC